MDHRGQGRHADASIRARQRRPVDGVADSIACPVPGVESPDRAGNTLTMSDVSPAPVLDFRNTNSLWSSVLVETLVRSGVTQAVISPGSRSTPLTVAMARHPAIEA